MAGTAKNRTTRGNRSKKPKGSSSTGTTNTTDNDSSLSKPTNEHTDDDKHSSQTAPKKQRKAFRDSRSMTFIIGAILGLLLALYFGAKHHPSTAELDLDTLLNFSGLNEVLDDWKDTLALPSGIQSILNDFTASLTAKEAKGKDGISTESFKVGEFMKSEYQLTSKHPIVMVPGVISTGIESWSLTGPTPQCPSKPHFRKRLWGSTYMLRTMVLDKACWLKHIMLDPETGLDPEGVKMRAAQGFEAADFFMIGYWLWSKILENLAVIGYEPNTMSTASYDWRLSYLDLERRDGYFTKLKKSIEDSYQRTGEKSVLVGHSMGSQVVYYFMKWAEAEGADYGNGGANWVNTYIDSFVDISGSILGAPKAVPALLSGEMKDTVQLNALAVYGLEKFFSRRERLDMLRSFGGVASMLPKGGDFIWGGADYPSFEDHIGNQTSGHSHKAFVQFADSGENGEYSNKSYTLAESLDLLLDESPEYFQRRTKEHYSYGVATTAQELITNNQDHTKWSNPLEAALPNAPDLKIYCFYGYGNPTERSYIYEKDKDPNQSRINITISTDTKSESVFLTDGDGTLPLLTHAMCHKWKTSQHLNPGSSEVKIVELKHEPDRFDIRGGAQTAEHVDILGSAKLNELILKVASGRGDLIEEKLDTGLNDWVQERVWLDFEEKNLL
ncbi:hypothetical protein WICPIJ_002291 [Wickerhamomyces pijperi]|uniref:Phospholipid:diacylglycerol acyltransferase n=1 Tax=Wickerhamomyces pijperi TaxID=599730 RepID=A0A9P8Q9Z1_WICPI|nr:hypothetical protein WICPIJ_002291 [Wickerhamomyces pijperi]